MAEEPEPRKFPTPEEVEQTVFGETLSATPEDVAVSKLRESLIPAVDSIIQVACYGENSSLRLNASKYIVDRILGKEAKAPDKQAALDRLLDRITKDE